MRIGTHLGPVFLSFASFAVEIIVSIVYLRPHRPPGLRDGSEVRFTVMAWGRCQIYWVFLGWRLRPAQGGPLVKKETVPARLHPVAFLSDGEGERSLSEEVDA